MIDLLCLKFALDALTRSKLQDEFAEISQKEKKTIILITNDVDEAILLADRIIPLNPGPKASFGPEFKLTGIENGLNGCF